jgi:hypothetical protein
MGAEIVMALRGFHTLNTERLLAEGLCQQSVQRAHPSDTAHDSIRKLSNRLKPFRATILPSVAHQAGDVVPPSINVPGLPILHSVLRSVVTSVLVAENESNNGGFTWSDKRIVEKQQ